MKEDFRSPMSVADLEFPLSVGDWEFEGRSISSLQNGGALHKVSTACLCVNPVRSILSTSRIRSPEIEHLFAKQYLHTMENNIHCSTANYYFTTYESSHGISCKLRHFTCSDVAIFFKFKNNFCKPKCWKLVLAKTDELITILK